MIRAIIVLHRYLGVAVGLVMTAWCLSGFVMMYHGYPQTTPQERLQGLERLRLDGCCDLARLKLDDAEAVSGFRLEMLAGRPVLRLRLESGRPRVLDLLSGDPLDQIIPSMALAVARSYGAGRHIAGSPLRLGLLDQDQWTLEGAGRRGPIHKLRFDDRAGTDVYVADATGEVVQDTSRAERVWSWFGAVPHWLYPTVLRRNGPLWTNVVVWTSLVGVFLTVTGLWLGVVRFRRYASGRWSPFRGWAFWHHMAGLAAGSLTLAWVASGLLTMNPWGLLESEAGLPQRTRLAGAATGVEVKRVLSLAPALAVGDPARDDVVQLRSATLGGRLFVMAVQRSGGMARFDASGRPSPLHAAELARAIAGLDGGRGAALARIVEPDAYYYTGYEAAAKLPAYRVGLADADRTTLYLDADTGEVVRGVDATARASRWLHTGLHDWDFAGLRTRPLWDAVVLALLAGATAVCATGTWLALQRVKLDLRKASRRTWRLPTKT